MRLIHLCCAVVCVVFLKIGVSENRAVTTCPRGYLPCDNGDCVRRETWCDGRRDCRDGSDEAYCEEKGRGWFSDADPNKCEETHFLCANGPCVPKSAKCDGYTDCIDGTDEKNCEQESSEDYHEATSEEQEEIKTYIPQISEVASDSFKEEGLEFSTESPTQAAISVSIREHYNSYDTRQITSPEQTWSSVISVTPSYEANRDPYRSNTHPTRGYDARRRDSDQSQTQATRAYDTRRRDPDPFNTQATRTYDSRRRDSDQSQTQATRAYDTRRSPDQSSTQETRFYDVRQSHSQANRVYDPRRQDLDLSLTPVPLSFLPSLHVPKKDRHPSVIHHFYTDQGHYYGYFDTEGRFIVLHPTTTENPPTTYPPVPTGTPRVTGVPVVFDRRLRFPSRFYFPRNYTRIYGDKNLSYLMKGKEWILSIRNTSGGWGKETPRALIALSLINNSFVSGTYGNDVMQKYFQVFLGTNLLRADAKMTTLNRLAMSINALLATCQNPRDFHGTDLTELVRRRLVTLNQRNPLRDSNGRYRDAFINPSVYLSLCLAGRELSEDEVECLVKHCRAHATQDEMARDMLSLSVTALSCHLRQTKSRSSDHNTSVEYLLSNATVHLLQRMKSDGSFGSVYSTAIAAQALLSVNESRYWNPEQTFNFLKRHQQEDGSFGDFLATYYTLPALSGRSLLYLRNTQCYPPKVERDFTPSEIIDHTGPKHYVQYSLYFGYPLGNGYSIKLHVPQGINIFDIMRVAEYENNNFNFSYEEINGDVYVYSISNVPNDSEQGFGWNLYIKSSDGEQTTLVPQERRTEDIRKLYPRNDQQVIFWYHSNSIRE